MLQKAGKACHGRTFELTEPILKFEDNELL